MKTRRIAGLVVVVALCFGMMTNHTQAAEAKNLIENGSFDIGETKPDGWNTNTWSGKGKFDYSFVARSDDHSVMLSSEDGGDLSWFQNVTVEPFSRYRLSGWIKTESLGGGTGEGALLNLHNMQGVKTKALVGTNDWTKVQCEFDTMNNSIQINCLFGGWGTAKGKAWFDDLKLEKIGTVTNESKTVESKVAIDTTRTFEPISKYIYGQFIEHLGRCIYGGIWAEMLEDRKFYFPVPAKGDIWRLTGSQASVLAASPWKVIGPEGSVSMIDTDAYVGTHTPEITAAATKTGICQEELALIKDKEYVGRVILSGDRTAAPVSISLVWGDAPGQRQTIKIKKLNAKYTKVPFKFRSKASTDNGRLEIVSKGTGKFKVGVVSLMPADNIQGFRKDTLALLRELNSPVYRWPGGNFVSGYDWRDGLGDRDKRPTRTNPAWTGIETNDVGMDEFVQLCRLIDTEPMIAVNTGFGDAYSAADEVEYANGSKDTRYGKIRAANGNPNSYKVKWWCVGNEMFGSWQLGYMRLNHYVLKHNQVEEKMRQVDPTIQTVGVGNVGDWTKGMLNSCADNMDIISEHFYNQGRGDITAHVRQIPDNIKRIANAHREYRSTLDSLKGKDIRVALDEWNYWYGPHVYGELGTRYFLQDALGIAAGLHEYFRNSDIYMMANYAQTVNVIGCIKTTKTQAGFATTALPLMLYRKEFGTIPVKVGDTQNALDITAALTEDKKSLTIAVVNPTWNTCKLTIDLSGKTPAGNAKTWLITGDNPLLYNTPGEEEKVSIQDAPPTDLTKEVTLKPLSITMYKVSLR